MKAIKPCFIKSFCLLSLFFLSLVSFLLLGAAVKLHLLTQVVSSGAPKLIALHLHAGAAGEALSLCLPFSPCSGKVKRAVIINQQVYCVSAQNLEISCLFIRVGWLAGTLQQNGRFLSLLKATSSLYGSKLRLKP